MKKILGLLAALAMTSAGLLFGGCSKEPELPDPYIVKIGKKEYSLLQSSRGLENTFGSYIDGDSPDCLIYTSPEVTESGYTVRTFTPLDTSAEQLSLYNGVTAATSKDELLGILGKTYIWTDSEGRADYMEFFVNGEEVSYEKLRAALSYDGYKETRYAILGSGRKFCRELLKEAESGNYMVIHYTCFENGKMEISMEISQIKT